MAHHFDSPIPRTRTKRIFGHQVPVDGEDLPFMFVPRSNRKVIDGDIKQLDRAIPRRSQDLILM